MGWRETRASRRRLILLTSAIGIGVGALVAINGFTENLADAVEREARALLGADISIISRRPFSSNVEGLIDSLTQHAAGLAGCDTSPCALPAYRRIARTTEFDAMAFVPRTTGTRLVQVSALEGPFPYYGTVETDPAEAWDSAQAGRSAIVDPTLLSALDARIGDTLALGEARFRVTGTIIHIPGDVGIQSVLGPRVFIPRKYLEETKLLGFGARVRYEAFLKLEPGMDADEIASEYRSQLRTERVRIRTVQSERRQLDRTLTQFGRFLGLVALMALLLGGLGVASAVHVFVKQKRESIAVLRCLGATAGTVFRTYLSQALAIGLVGSLLGVGLGITVQLLLPTVLRDVLPVDVDVSPSAKAIVLGVTTGVWVASIFALLPLLKVRHISPLGALREPFETGLRTPRDRYRWLARAGLGISVVLLAIIQAGNWLQGLAFAAAVGVGLTVLWGAAVGLTKAVRRWLPARSPYLLRQGLANLFRPANQTVAVILALGFGVFLLSTLFLVQQNFLRQLRFDSVEQRPNLLIFDVQPDQLEPLQDEIRTAGLPLVQAVPLVPMRIASVNGEPVLRATTGQEEGDSVASATWAHRREYRSTYRDTLVDSERLVAGDWWSEDLELEADEAVPVSMEADVAEVLEVGVGDEIVRYAQGISVPSTITSIREVDWAQFQPNFFAVFAPGALEEAPQMFVTQTRADDPIARGTFQRRLAERFPNVSSIDLMAVQQALDRIIGRVVAAVRFVAAFSLITGIIVLVGALATSRFQRLREGVLLKTLGATRRQIVRIVLAEYAVLGLLAAAVAIVLSIAAGWGLVTFVFETSFAVPMGPLAALAAGMAVLTMGVGVWNSRAIFRATPLQVLRAE
jgi:putative ABC transport system permease protein